MPAPSFRKGGLATALSLLLIAASLAQAQSECGNGTCDQGETQENCPVDCHPDPICGNLICEPQVGENQTTCPGDCGGCGDFVCDAAGGETAESCALDCGVCVPKSCGSQCGQVWDGCSTTLDCGPCEPSCDFSDIPPHLQFCCGNGECDGGENPNNCAQDCAGECGDLICSPLRGETPNNCADCCYTEYCTAGCAGVPTFALSAQQATVYEPVSFTAFTEHVQGNAVNWDFGDGNHCDGCALTVQHTYLTPGLKTIRMTATENVCSSTQVSFPLYLQVQDRALRHGDYALVTGHTLPTTLTCGQTTTAAITLRNLGETTWTAAGGYALGAVGDADPFAPATRFPLPPGISVAPFEYYTFQVPLTTSQTGLGVSDWQMVHEGVAWFGETASSTITPTGSCTGGPPTEEPFTFTCNATVKDGYGRPFAGALVKFMLTKHTSDAGYASDEEVAFKDGTTDAMGRVNLSATIYSGVANRMECAVFDTRFENKTKRETPWHTGLRQIQWDTDRRPRNTTMTLSADGDFALAPTADDARWLVGRKSEVGKARLYLPAGREYGQVQGVVVIPEPMDFQEQTAELRRDWQEFWLVFRKIATALYAKGVALWLAEPYRTGQNLHEQAAELAQAIQAAANFDGVSGRKVVVAGYSLGGIVARIATARWEADAVWRAELGLQSTIPVSMVIFGDSPLRGAVANVDLQDLLWDRDQAHLSNLNSCAVQQLLQESIGGKNMDASAANWNNFYATGAGVSFVSPKGVCDTRVNNVCSCEAGPPVFTINGDGYPHTAEVAALAVSAWGQPNQCYGDDRDLTSGGARLCVDAETPLPGDTFAHLSAPWCLFESTSRDFRVRAQDLVPGSRLSTRFDQTSFFGPASGAWLGVLFAGLGPLLCPASLGGTATLEQFFAPTFIPISSALDGTSPQTSYFGQNAAWLDYNASHDVLPNPLMAWLFGKLQQAFASSLGPVANASLTAPPALTAGVQASFTATGSTGGNGQPFGAFWDFGDGQGATGLTATHAFAAPGVYGVSLTVVGQAGAEASTGTMVRVGEPPEGNTPQGSAVVVNSRDEDGTFPVRLQFDGVLKSGTSMSAPVSISPSELPSGTQWVRRIDTTAETFSSDGGGIEICLSRLAIDGEASRFRVFHQADSTWSDITTTYDAVAERACGKATSLGRVALVKLSESCAPPATCFLEPPVTPAPLLSPAPGTYSGSVAVSATAASGVVVRYTTNGGVPSADSAVLPGTLSLTSSATVKVRAFLPDHAPSVVVQANYVVESTGPQLVEWTNLINTGGPAGILTKNSGGAAGWDAGAVSTRAIASGDGYVEFRAGNTSEYVMAGLSHGDSTPSWDDVDHAFYLYPSGSVSIYEFGAIRAQGISTFVAGDAFRVSVQGGVVKYWKNGALLYTSTVAPTYPLLLDAAMYSLGAVISDATIAGNLIFVGAARPTLSPSPANFPVAQNVAVSSVTPGTTVRYTLDGEDPTVNSPALSPGETIPVPGPFAIVKARAFGPGLFASSVTSGSYSIGLPTTETVEWTRLANVTASAGTITKTAGGLATWDAGASSTRAITSPNGYVEFTANPGEYAFAGLSVGDADVAWSEIDYAFYVYPSGSIAVYENGVWREGVSATFVGGDTLRVAIENGVVRYRKNGSLVYTSQISPTYPLRVDTSIYRPGGAVQNATIGGALVWVGAARPLLTPSPGNYADPLNVTVTGPTPGSVIRYTVNGGEPTTSSPAVASGGDVSITGPLSILKATAWVPGLTTSPSASSHYSVGPVVTEPVQWTGMVNVSAAGDTITKTGGGTGAWDAGAVSTQAIVSADGYLEFRANPGEYAFAGFSHGDSGVGWAGIDYALYLYPTGSIAIYEKGVLREGVSATFIAGDTLRVSVEGGVVKYRKNGALIYTSSVVPVFPLSVDTALFRIGASIQQAVVSGNLVR